MPRIGLLLLSALAVSAAACGDSSNTVQTDVTIPKWNGVVDLAIDSLNGTNDEFGLVSGLAVDRAGRIYVADGQFSSLAVFDSTGRHLYNIGRQGAGPGEFNHPCCLAFDRQDGLWLRDTGNGRYNRYSVSDTGARFRGQVVTPSPDVGYAASLTFDQAGRLVNVRPVHGPGDLSDIARLHIDSAGHVVEADTIIGPPQDSLGYRPITKGNVTFFLHQPYGPDFLVAHAPGGGWARAVSSRYLIHWVVADDTAPAITIRRDVIGPALSAGERSRADSQLNADATKLGLAGSAVPFKVPGAKPPVKNIFFDQTGRLWVELSMAEGEARRADVYDTTGRRLVLAQWPKDVDIGFGYIGDRVAYGVRRDSLGVARVVRVRFHPG
jgi:hypothetical protein